MKLNEYTTCPYCNSIQVTESYCPACNRRLGPEDWERKQERIKHLNEREGEWTRQGMGTLGHFSNAEMIA